MTVVTERFVCVGYAPGPRGNLKAFDGPSGDRLAKLMGLPGRAGLLSTLECVNMLDREPMTDANPSIPRSAGRAAADALAPRLNGRVVIMCGVDVPRWFGLDSHPQFTWRRAHLRGGEELVYATVPHPSGVCRLWNDLATRQSAQRFLREALQLGPGVVRDDVSGISTALASMERGDALLTYEQAAPMLSVTREHLRQMVHRRQVPHVRVSGRTVRFREDDLRVHLARASR